MPYILLHSQGTIKSHQCYLLLGKTKMCYLKLATMLQSFMNTISYTHADNLRLTYTAITI